MWNNTHGYAHTPALLLLQQASAPHLSMSSLVSPSWRRSEREQNQRRATLMGVVRQAVNTSAGRSGFCDAKPSSKGRWQEKSAKSNSH